MNLVIFKGISDEEKTKAVKELISHSTPNQDFYFMIFLSIIMATFGLLIDNTPVVIGSMLVAPMMHPILTMALGIVMADTKIIWRSGVTILLSMSIGIVAAVVITALFSPGDLNLEQTSFYNVEESFIYSAIAIVAGLAASFATTKPKLNPTMPGTAIAVTLVPPLAAIGIGIAKLDWQIITNSFVLFIVNVFGIIFASMFVFSLMNF